MLLLMIGFILNRPEKEMSFRIEIGIKNEGTGGHSNVYKTHIYWLDT